MKLLVVSNGYPPRGRFGTEFYTRELVRGLVRRGHEPLVLHPVREGAGPRGSIEEVVEEGVRVLLLSRPGRAGEGLRESYADPAVEAAFAGALERHRPELVHFVYLGWGLSFGLPAVALARGIPSVATLTDYGLFCHRGQMFDHRLERCFGPHPPEVCARCIREPGPHDGGRARVALKRAAVRALATFGGAGRVVMRADVAARERAARACVEAVATFIAPTRSLAAVARRSGVPAEKLVHLVYAFDEAPYAAARPAPAGPFRFGFCGQLAPHKGVATLLDAARLLAARAPEGWELVLHGAAPGGRHAAFAPALLARGMPPHARLEPPFPPEDAPRVLAGLSALVVPSLWDENAPLACLQARAAGVPLVASDVPGIAEVAAADALLVPPGDAPRLAAAMARAIARGARRSVQVGLPLACEEHLARIEALYRSAAGAAALP